MEYWTYILLGYLNWLTCRKKTPPGHSSSSSPEDEKKRLIRELGRKPSVEKVSLYVRKSSVEDSKTTSQPTPNGNSEQSRSKKFIDSVARKTPDVPTDFLKTIEEERTKSPGEFSFRENFNNQPDPDYYLWIPTLFYTLW